MQRATPFNETSTLSSLGTQETLSLRRDHSVFTYSKLQSLHDVVFRRADCGGQVPVSVQLAALCCSKAISKEPFTVEHLQDDTSIRWALWAQGIQTNCKYITRLSVWMLIAMTLFERPLWCTTQNSSCEDPSYFTFGVYFEDRWAVVIELVAWIWFAFDLALTMLVVGMQMSLASLREHLDKVVRAVLLVGLGVDIALVLCVSPERLRWRAAPYLRILLCALQNQTTIQEAVTFMHGLKAFLRMLLLLEVFVLTGAWFGVISLAAQKGHVAFKDLGDAFWELQILLTTNNFPNIMIEGGYNERRSIGMFFVVYLIVGFFLLLPMVMSVVYQGYKAHRQELKTLYVANQRSLLDGAFDVLDEECSGKLTMPHLGMFLFELGRIRSSLGMHDHVKRHLIFGVLDKSGDGCVDKNEFKHLIKVLRWQFEVADQTPLLQRVAPQLWSVLDSMLRRVPESFFDLSLIIYGALLVYKAWPLIMDAHAEMRSDWLSRDLLNIALGIFMVEVLIKVLVLGERYLVSWRCMLDITAIAGFIIARAYKHFNEDSDDTWVHLAMNFRLVRVFRLVYRLPGFDRTFKSFSGLEKAARRILPFYMTIFVLFDILGCDLYGGLITKDVTKPGTQALAKTDFAAAEFYSLNFNDRAGGAMLLFACLVLNNFSVYVEAFVVVSGMWARIFFWSFWVCGVLSGLNFVMAVMIDAVVSELSVDNDDSSFKRGSSQHLLQDAAVISGTKTGVEGAYVVTKRKYDADELSDESGEDDSNFSRAFAQITEATTENDTYPRRERFSL